MLLRSAYIPPPDAARMENVGDVAEGRARFLVDRFPNLDYLLRTRYEWMNDYLEGLEKVVELGAGSGLSKLYITNPRVMVTDCRPAEWLDMTVDALDMPFEDESLDALFCSGIVHHLAFPRRFFLEATRVLKPGGLLLIQDVHCSLLIRVVLRLMRMEGWSYDVDVFSETEPSNNPDDPWSGNNAVFDLIFADLDRFARCYPKLSIEHRQYCECLVLFASGGVTAKVTVPRLPRPVLSLLGRLDRMIAALVPDLAAVSQKVVIRRR
jgi:SAM-dependent methyltransferase